ncbi:MAG: hypothetical protein CMM10_09610 [Rhodospirillaceae bacterium]|jgi:hypothetical protein|nr:hypothetical protein [Rhodospirillaceae bacterium]MDP6644280.1 hypothetical protein [Rhodospirillales bacterium]|tara:strand:+ start:780 stop:1244 length:465 start_codon:yes stop_codon:yes gene_type:complete
MVYRLAGNQITLFLFTLAIIIGAAGIMSDQIKFLTNNLHMDFIPTEVGLENSIAILIAAFGIFLEHRRWLLDRIHPDGLSEKVEQFDRYSHDIGVLLIMIAILMEAADVLFLALNTWGFEFAGLKYSEVLVLFAINLLAIITILLFAWRIIRRN